MKKNERKCFNKISAYVKTLSLRTLLDFIFDQIFRLSGVTFSLHQLIAKRLNSKRVIRKLPFYVKKTNKIKGTVLLVLYCTVCYNTKVFEKGAHVYFSCFQKLNSLNSSFFTHTRFLYRVGIKEKPNS